MSDQAKAKLIQFCLLLFWLCLPTALFAATDFITVNGYEIEYEIAGNGAEIVLLEAGGSAGISDWEPVFKTMAQHATVIRYSRLGNGNSTPIRQSFTSRDYANQAQALLDKLDILDTNTLLPSAL